MGGRHNKEASYGLKAKASAFIASSEVCVPKLGGDSPNATFRSNDFLALETPPGTARTRDEKKKKKGTEADNRRQSSASTASLEPVKIISVDVTKSRSRLRFKGGSLSPKQKSGSPLTPISPSFATPSVSRSPSPSVSQSPSSSQKSFRRLLMTQLQNTPTPDPDYEFTADTNREAPYEHMRYQRKRSAERSNCSNLSYKLLHRQSCSKVCLQHSSAGKAKDMMVLLKQAIDTDQEAGKKGRSSVVVKVLQTSPQRKTEVSEKRLRVSIKHSESTAAYIPRTKNAFIIQPKVPVSLPSEELNKHSRAEHQWQWKGRYGTSPKAGRPVL